MKLINMYRLQSSKQSSSARLIFDYILPLGLFIITFFTMLLSGSELSGAFPRTTIVLLRGLPYSLAVFSIVGAHGFGHYFAARLSNVGARLPYFVPSLFVFGTGGAYTKLQWPIGKRRVLLKVFSFGPICGFFASWLVLAIGLSYSRIINSSDIIRPAANLGDSIITYLTGILIKGYIPQGKDIELHPIALAGYLGLFYNMWHLLPIGRLDGGRICYGLWGYKRTFWISMAMIGILVSLSLIWIRWIGMAAFGGICMILFRRQYPSDKYDEDLDNVSKALCWISLVILIVSFSPVPMFLGKMP
ncbi:MAG: site-2 protease family protein [bacterium]|nr:site-2 protease family protein [bacterium]